MSAVAREWGVDRKVVEDYFAILDDLLLAVRLPVFRRRAKRKSVTHPKFYVFDAGVYRAMRSRGPLDTAEEIDGAALATLVLQELRATNDYHGLGYQLSYRRTTAGLKVDFVLYGEHGLIAIEVKRAVVFRADYPTARTLCLYGGTRAHVHAGVRVLPVAEALSQLTSLLSA